jgi:hypothetical protein
MSRDFTVAVAINAYDPPNTLYQCVADIEDFCLPVLRRHRPEFAHPNNLWKLLDKRATYANIRVRINWLCSIAAPGDRILFCYSGHGTPVESTTESDGWDEAIVPVDYDGDDDKLIRDDMFVPLMSLPKSIPSVFIFDSCFSGGMDDIAFRRIRKFRRVAEEFGSVIIQACSEYETAAETEHGGALMSTLFTKFDDCPDRPLYSLLDLVKHSIDGQSIEYAGNEEMLSVPFLTSH